MTGADLTVLHVINQVAGHGGAEVSLGQLAVALQGEGIRSVVVPLYPYDGGAEAARLTAAGVTVLDPVGGGPRAVARLRRAIRSTGADVVHTSLFDADLYGRLAARWAAVPVLVSLVNSQYVPEARAALPAPWKLDVVRQVDGFLARHLTTRFHALTHATAEAGRVALRLSDVPVDVVSRGRDLAALGPTGGRPDAAARDHVGLPRDVPVLLNVGRQERQKGQVDLLRALPQVLARYPDAVLVLAGREGSATQDLRAESRRLGLGGSVALLGARADVPDLLRAADVFVFSSRWEGLGGAVLEALALAVPVVAFAIPPVAELVGEDGVLVPPGDVQGLAAGVLQVLDGRQEALDRAQRGALRVRQHCELSAVASRMAEVYRATVA